MSPTSPSAQPSEGQIADIVGTRILIGVQMVNISRLSTHPVPLTGRGLITVAGQGPKDSNGAGKSSFIAAISLLHADDQWRLASGAAGAAELLFTAELAAQEAHYANADHGYIIGVFVDPAADDLARLEATALTVWLRVNRKAPYLDLRWYFGLHVPQGAGEAERARLADGLWAQLPTSNGRTDFHANRIAAVLFGEHARCVSFLSTSVRASATANLLAQPLNELSPARIFDAIASLTGLDRELGQEQSLRSTEHSHRLKVTAAETELEAWEREMAIVEAGIVKREDAREHLGRAKAAWQARCALHYIDGITRHQEIGEALEELDARVEDLRGQAKRIGDELKGLRDDKAFATRNQEIKNAYETLDRADRELETAQGVDAREAEQLTHSHRDLTEKARAADGRSLKQAIEEQAKAQTDFEEALSAQGVAKAEAEAATRALAAVEAGEDLAAGELAAVRQAGADAAALLDVLQLDADQREAWEPRLLPYRSALVVARAHIDNARKALCGRPASIIIPADPGGPNSSHGHPGLPRCTDQRFDLNTFLSVLAERAGGDPGVIDERAAILVPGQFPEPLTGRAGRITAARTECTRTSKLLTAADQALTDARTDLTRATTRTTAARAADDAEAALEKIKKLRKAIEQRTKRRDLDKPLLDRARANYEESLGIQQSRRDKIKTLEGEKGRHEATANALLGQKTNLVTERTALDLDARARAWGASAEAARSFIAALEEDQQALRVADFNQEACRHLADAVRACFPEETPEEQMPGEIRQLLITQRWHHATLEARVRVAPDLLRALHTHLTGTERHDAYQIEQITTQRAARTADLNAARSGLTEAERTCRAHRGSLALGIKAKLKQVADEFDQLDQEYGGYGAALDYPEPEPPADPDKPWQWTVAPMWRRAEGQRPARYNLKANTAQMDEKAAKLVCAAALAGASDRPLVLVLDELGRNLGSQHRREAVALFERIGRDRNITVIGALQDDMERYALEASGLYIKLRRTSDTLAYNEPPVVIGDEDNHARVEMLKDWLTTQRPADDDADKRAAA